MKTGTDKTKTMATAAGQARNDEIYRAAARLLVQKGYAGTSMTDLANTVGLTKAALYHYISSKQDMLFQILNHALDALEDRVIEPAQAIEDPEERLRELIRLQANGLLEGGGDFALLFPERRHLEPVQQKAVVMRVKKYLDLIAEAMREMDQAGKLQDLNIDIAARHIAQTIAGIARWYSKESGIPKDLIVEQTVKFNMSAILK